MTQTMSERLDDLLRLEALVESTCTCGRGTDRASHEEPCPFAAHTAHLPDLPPDYQPMAYRTGPPVVDVWADAEELECTHRPRRLATCRSCRSQDAAEQLERICGR